MKWALPAELQAASEGILFLRWRHGKVVLVNNHTPGREVSLQINSGTKWVELGESEESVRKNRFDGEGRIKGDSDQNTVCLCVCVCTRAHTCKTVEKSLALPMTVNCTQMQATQCFYFSSFFFSFVWTFKGESLKYLDLFFCSAILSSLFRFKNLC